MKVPGKLERTTSGYKVSGHWTLPFYENLRQAVSRTTAAPADFADLDFTGLEAIDTAGAFLLADLVGADRLISEVAASPALSPERQALIQAIASAAAQPAAPQDKPLPDLIRVLGQAGQRVEALWRNARLLLGFIGLTLATFFYSLIRPWRWRVTPLVAHIHQTGLNALPIVALLTFLVGAVVAFLGATVLKDFGATIYTVNLVAYSFLREFGVLLAAILLAGRTASAFTAQLGSMKANEEIDAIRTQGLDPMELLVIPRVLAMMISLPILTFAGMISGIIGGALVCILSLDITLAQILIILQRDVPISHLLVGLGKAPLFAFMIAVIGCLEGFKVSGSAQSVGEHTTSSVVQSIFLVILLDAIAALFFMEMDW